MYFGIGMMRRGQMSCFIWWEHVGASGILFPKRGPAQKHLAATLAATVLKMLSTYPRLLGAIQVPGVAPILQNNQDTQDPQHAGDPSYLGVGGFCNML